MGSVNKELRIEVAGVEYTCRADFEALERIEQHMGIGHITQRLQSEDVRLSEVARFVHCALPVSAGLSYKEVGNWIMKTDGALTAGIQFIGEFIAATFNAGPEEPIEGDGDPGE